MAQFGGFPFGDHNGFLYNIAPFPFVEDEAEHLKMAHDTYEVYVNGAFVGHKILLNMNEDVKDIDSFLKSRGFFGYQSEKKGNEYHLQTNDSYQSELMRENLAIYLQIR